MNLYIDIGNTTIKFAVDDADNVKKVLFFLSKEFNNHKLEVYELFEKYNINKAYISSVNPTAYNILYKTLTKKMGKNNVITIGPRDPVNFGIDIEFPDELGTDLLCDMEGALIKYNAPLLIIDVGTASKVLYMPKNKVFTSCAIVPGIEVTMDLLYNSTSLLSKETLREPKKYLDSHNTSDVIVSSTVFGHADMLNGMIKRYEQETGEKCTKILTGGYAEFLKKYLDFAYEFEPNLAFLGLKEISRKK